MENKILVNLLNQTTSHLEAALSLSNTQLAAAQKEVSVLSEAVSLKKDKDVQVIRDCVMRVVDSGSMIGYTPVCEDNKRDAFISVGRSTYHVALELDGKNSKTFVLHDLEKAKEAAEVWVAEGRKPKGVETKRKNK